MLSAGLLGGPGIGYMQDLNASKHLEETHPETYSRYAAESESGFLIFPKVKGLDGQKVGLILDRPPAATLLKELRRAATAGNIPDALKTQKDWWDGVGEVNSSVDHTPVEEAKIHGGRTALKWTAVVPAMMFVGYLMMVLYFKVQGGYKTVEINETDEGKPTDAK
jgi:hypothetical protein